MNLGELVKLFEFQFEFVFAYFQRLMIMLAGGDYEFHGYLLYLHHYTEWPLPLSLSEVSCIG